VTLALVHAWLFLHENLRIVLCRFDLRDGLPGSTIFAA
jgi:hypothetical protein